jgi:hypothetical protein
MKLERELRHKSEDMAASSRTSAEAAALSPAAPMIRPQVRNMRYGFKTIIANLPLTREESPRRPMAMAAPALLIRRQLRRTGADPMLEKH